MEKVSKKKTQLETAFFRRPLVSYTTVGALGWDVMRKVCKDKKNFVLRLCASACLGRDSV